MQRVGLVLGVLVLGFWILSLVSCAMTPPARVRAVPKPAWLLLIVLLPVLGGALWFAFGRTAAPRGPRPSSPPAGSSPAASSPSAYGRLAADERIRRMEEDLARLERESERPDDEPRPGRA